MPFVAAQAVTFRQRLLLALSLSWVAGYVNVAIVTLCGTTVSHVTGNVTTFGLHLAEVTGGSGTWATTLFLLHLPACFLTGAMLAQVLMHLARRSDARRPALWAIFAEMLLLTALSLALSGFQHNDHSAAWLWCVTSIGAIAMGLQNATITRISGAVVRTTHLTGVTTDLGTDVADLLFWLAGRGRRWKPGRGRRIAAGLRGRVEIRRIGLLASIFGSFLVGAVGGAAVVLNVPRLGLWPTVVFLAVVLTLDAARLRSTAA